MNTKSKHPLQDLKDWQLDEVAAYDIPIKDINMQNMYTRFLHERKTRKSGKRLLLIAAIAAVAVALSGIALAVSFGFDFGIFYNSLFNNPDVGERFEIGQMAVSNGIEITLISAVVDRSHAYFIIEMKDIEGDRLSGTMSILNESFTGGIHQIFTGPITYDEYERKATLALTVLYSYNIAELGAANLYIDAIQSIRVRTDHEALDFDLAAYAIERNSISLEEWHAVHWGGGWMGGLGWARDPDAASIWEEPVRPVKPLEHGDMSLSIGGFDWVYISNFGIADGFLHVQFMYTSEASQEHNQRYGFFNENLCLVDGNGNVIDWYYCVTGDAHEMMFDIGDNTDFTGWRLALKGGESVIDDVIRGEWDIGYTFESNQAMQRRTMTAYPVSSPVFAMVEITCSPVMTSISMTAHGAYLDENNNWTRRVEGYDDKTDSEKLEAQSEYSQAIIEYYLSFGSPFLTLEDGSIVELVYPNEMFDWLGGSVWFQTDYFDIENLRSITFCGEKYLFSNAR